MSNFALNNMEGITLMPLSLNSVQIFSQLVLIQHNQMHYVLKYKFDTL